MSECSNCGGSEGTESLAINNSKFVDESQYVTEKDVDFDVDFSGHPDDPEMEVVTVTVCEDCYRDVKF